MKKKLIVTGVALSFPFVLAFGIKATQTICWRSDVSFIRPPSLDSWDPTERVEAARKAAEKFGAKK